MAEEPVAAGLNSTAGASPPAAAEPKKEESQKEEGGSSEFLPALKKFILETTKSQSPTPPPAPGRREVAGFILATLDLVLLYLLIPPDWYENRLFVFVTKLLPWLLGASFFVLATAIRDWVMQQCGKRGFLAIAIVLFMPLTLTQLPIFSVKAHVVPAIAEVSAIEHSGNKQRAVKMDRKGDDVRIFFPGLNSDKVKITDTGCERSEDFTAKFSRLGILRGTFAQLPLVGRLFARQIRLTPGYLLPLHASRGTPMVHIEGDFPDTFLHSLGEPEVAPSLAKCEAHSTKSGRFELDCPFSLNEHQFMPLPPGVYELTQEQEGCTKTAKEIHLERDKIDTVNFDGLPCRK
jgi:hypothetical protein